MSKTKSDYPANWEEISRYIRVTRAGNICEGSPHHYPDCRAAKLLPHPITGSTVILTTAHLDHDTTNNDYDNLRCLCQRCHLAHDRDENVKSAAITRRNKKITAGQLSLW